MIDLIYNNKVIASFKCQKDVTNFLKRGLNNADRYLKSHPELSGYKRLKDLKLNPKETYELAIIFC